MEDTGAILLQISTLKDMLDKVNDEIEASIQVTREIESEILKIDDIETSLDARESELLKMIYFSQFELSALIPLTVNSRKSVAALSEKINNLKRKRDGLLERLNKKRESFSTACTEFQKSLQDEDCNKLKQLLLEKESLEDEISTLCQKDTKFKSSVSALYEEIIQDPRSSNSVLAREILEGQAENEQIVREIDELKSALLTTISDVNGPW